MKRYSIRELKGRMSNFADEGNTFEEKVDIINQNLFCGILRDKFSEMSPEQFIKFVRGGLYFPEAKGRYKAVCRYLADVLSYVAGLSDRKPNSLRVYSASKELAKTHIDLEQVVKKGLEDFYRRVFEAMYEEDPNDFIDLLNNVYEAEKWIEELIDLDYAWNGTDDVEYHGQVLHFTEPGIAYEKYLQGNVDSIEDSAFEHMGMNEKTSPDVVLYAIFESDSRCYARRIIESLVEEYYLKPRKDNAPSIRTLCQAIDSQTDDGLREMLSLYKNINARTQDGKTLLSYAITHFNYDAVDLLVEMGADVNARDEDGDTPLHALAYNLCDGEFYLGDELELMVDAVWTPLIEHGADVNAKNRCGDTPLMTLATGSAGDTATYLLSKFIKAGADVNVKNNDGQTALMYAVEAVRTAETYGPPRSGNDTPHIPDVAIANIKALLDAGADTGVVDNSGKTAEDYAEGDEEILDLLLWSRYTDDEDE